MPKWVKWIIRNLTSSAPSPGWDESSRVTRLPVNQTGPFIPPFIRRPEFVPAKLGVIWCWDHSRPLGWREYQYWLARTMPQGWRIVDVPDDGAEVPGERAL